jgi:hypothetical protein
MKVTILSVACLAALTLSAPMPEADPDAFVNLGAVAIPAITGSALIDGLLLGKVAFLKAAILANLLLGSGAEDEAAYGPPETAYGAPEPVYEQPAESYEQPAETYGAPSSPPVSYEEPDTYGAPAADPVSYSAPLPSYGAPARF